MDDIGFTDRQIRDWLEYERVRLSGRYNMFEPNARVSAGLARDDYIFCMANYSALKEVAAAFGWIVGVA